MCSCWLITSALEGMLDDVKGLEDANAVEGSEKELEREREIGVEEEGFIFARRASSSASFLCLGSAAFSFSLI